MIPRIYGALNAVAAELAADGLAKGHINLEEQYAYRSVDDVYNRLGPLLARHKVCVLPHMLKRRCTERAGPMDLVLFHVTVHAAFEFVSAEDGSRHRVEAFGEALDSGDKGTAKAMQSAFKYALLQSFCVPLGPEDADARSLRPRIPARTPAPPEGWDRWSADVTQMIEKCRTKADLSALQERHRSLLASLARERADLYQALGAHIAERRTALVETGVDLEVQSSPPEAVGVVDVPGPRTGKSKSPRPRTRRKQPEPVDA